MKKIITMDNVMELDELHHVITEEENTIIHNYFLEANDNDITPNITGMNINDASVFIGYGDFIIESLLNIINALYEHEYDVQY